MVCAGRGRPLSLCPRAPTKQGVCEASIPGGAGAPRAEAGRQVASRPGGGRRPACLPLLSRLSPGVEGKRGQLRAPFSRAVAAGMWPRPWRTQRVRDWRACGRQAPGWSLLLQCQAGPRGEEPPPPPLLQTLPCCPQRLCQPQAVPVS